MLTTEAFNALLKTLEEPPPHVIFVLATTEPHKIPDTILSRCQRFDFRRIPPAALGGKIRRICEAEGIGIQPAAVEAIARRASGSFRDAESLLDQLAAYGEDEITLERVQELLGSVPTAAVAELAQAWIDSDLAAGLRLINGLVDQGVVARQLHLEVIEYLRGLLLVRAGGDDKLADASPEMLARMRQQASGLSLERLVDGLRLFGQGDHARGEIRPQLPLELAFAQAVLTGTVASEATAPAVAASAPAAAQAPRPASPAERTPAARARTRERGSAGEGETKARERRRPAQAAQPQAKAPEAAQAASPGPTLAGTASPAALAQQWPDLLQRVRPASRMLEALLRSARPCAVSEGRVLLEVDSEFHRGRLAEDANRHILEQALGEVLGAPCRVECVLAGRRPRPEAQDEAPPAVHEDPLVRYAVEDLGAEVRQVRGRSVDQPD
jgi:DNA polymerase-3 subunit gamma/tau